MSIEEKFFNVDSLRNEKLKELFLSEIRLFDIKEGEEIEFEIVFNIVQKICETDLEKMYLFYIIGLVSKFDDFESVWSSYDDVKFVM